MIRYLTVFALLFATAGARAVDPGTAIGHIAREEGTLTFRYAVALRQDDAEHLLLAGPGLWVLLSDAPVEPEALMGGEFPPAVDMARDGKFKGALLQFDPAKRESLLISLLDGQPGSSTLTLEDSKGLWKELRVENNRVSGAIEDEDGRQFAFDAPIYEDPMVEQLRGPAAQASPFVALLRQEADAYARGDTASALALNSERRRAMLVSLLPEAAAQVRTEAASMKAEIAKIDQIYVRANTAIAKGAGDSAWNFRREKGVWKID